MVMEIARTNDYILMRLSHGENILSSIEEVVSQEKSTLMVFAGIGMITDFELGFFNEGKYITKSFKHPHELLSLQGSIASEGAPRMHVHAIVADKEHKAFGGHLMKGWAWMSNEICLIRMKGVTTKRWRDDQKGVAVLHVSQVVD